MMLVLTATIVAIAVYLSTTVGTQHAQRRTAKYQEHDLVTREIRDGSKAFFRVRVKNDADRIAVTRRGIIIGDYGTFVIASSATSDGFSKLQAKPLATTVHLLNGAFDPIKEQSAITIGGETESDGYYVLQLGVTPTDEILDSLTESGIEILQYVSHQAFYVYGSGEAIAKAANHSRVRWVGRLLPEHKMSKVLGEQLAAVRANREPKGGLSRIERPRKGFGIFDVVVFKRADLSTAVSKIVLASGAKVRNAIDLPSNFFNVVRVEVPLNAVEKIAEIPEVVSIEAWMRPEKEDEIAAQIISGNFVGNTIDPPGYDPLMQFGVNGQNVTVAVVDDGVGIPGDGGFYVTGSNAVNGPLRGATTGAQGHGHLQASIIAGDTPFSVLDPNGYNYGSGIAPKSNIVNIPLLRTGYTGTEADTANDTVTTAGPNGVLGFISNNSWGNGTNGNAYDSLAAQFDGFVRDATFASGIDPMVIVFSAGNSGGSGLTRPKMAKNVIAVAASENVRPTLNSSGGTTGVADNLEQLPDFSSRGPAADTRIKPDITAPGDAVTGGRSGPDALFGNIDANHRVSSGTSHAAPQVAGAAALFTQFWKNNSSNVNPSPALLKAAIINSGTEMTGTGATNPLPNGAEGWGRLNMRFMLNTGVATKYINQNINLTDPGQSVSFSGVIADSTKETRVALVWTDPPGSTDPALVNDLDLTVTIGGNTYLGNVFSGGSSAVGGTPDDRNNVENVRLPAGIPNGTPFELRVDAAALNGNGILGNADATDQHFALIAYNLIETPSAIVQSNAASQISESNIPANNVPDPGETVTVSLTLQNVGTAPTSNLTATLQSTGGILSPSAPQDYGSVLANSLSSALNFSFRVDPLLPCGSEITLTWDLQDGAIDHGTVSATFRTGVVVIGNTESFSNTGTISIPATGSGSSAGSPASPYPSNVTVTGLSSSASKVTVTLNNITHSFPSDVDVLLVNPAGRKFVLMSDVIGGSNWTGQSYTFDDSAASLIPATGTPPASGTFRPTNYGTTDLFPAPAPTGPFLNPASGGVETLASALAGDLGGNPNGTWSLYVTDDASSDNGSFGGGWSLAITQSFSQCSQAPTAAGVTVSGRVVDSNGRSAINAVVSFADGGGTIWNARTNTFGYFRIANLPAGNDYIVSVTSKRYRFSPVILSVSDSVTDLVIRAEP